MQTAASPHGVLERLFREGRRFAFDQAVWLLENGLAGGVTPGTNSEVQRERIRFRPHRVTVFPAADVKRVERLPGDGARVVATFMGLYGVDSPLPLHLHESIEVEAEGAESLRDFLDIFNHRLYAYFYRSWKKYQVGLHFEQSDRNEYARMLLSLAGLEMQQARDGMAVLSSRLTAFAGRLSGSVRNAEGLKALVAELLDGIQAEVVENLPRWVALPERPSLGRHARLRAALGQTATVGAKVYDLTGKFRVVLGPLTLVQYRSLLPSGEQARLVHALVRLYAPDYLAFDVELLLKAAEVPPLKLGDTHVQIGRNSWLGRPAGDVVSVVVAYE